MHIKIKNQYNNILRYLLLLITVLSSFVINSHGMMADTKKSHNQVKKINDNNNYDIPVYQTNNSKCIKAYDPLEKVNRKIFMFNSILDTFILKPVAKNYDHFTNNYTKDRVRGALSNLKEPSTSVNYMLQGRAKHSFRSLTRFAINSTFGIFGMFDVSGKYFKIKSKKQTLGNTFAYYGVGPGPYIVLPIIGSINTRDLPGNLVVDSFLLNPTSYFLPKTASTVKTYTGMVSNRADTIPFTDNIVKNSVDPYADIRNALMQAREKEMEYPEGFTCPKLNTN
ncbi:MAG TPA: VacJ family lipoprotein [Candidatus Megaira endosymbiont of Hartmannula sinica]|nr:VacJ family lipoprotein [Candidatus Megaera endosymbiont of Hartmannula sinica]